MPSPLVSHWAFPPELRFLNHGSFGATPKAVTARQQAMLTHMEENPMRFFLRAFEGLSDAARGALAQLLHADADDIAWVNNATEGVNTVLRSLPFSAGDEIVITSHGYNACNQAAHYVAERQGARVVVAQVPFPIESPAQVTAAITAALTPRTRLVLVDHITSPTALVFPVKDIVALCEARGIETLIDGAHAPGQVPVDLNALAASYYVANCHKWLCAPKGAAFLWARRDKQSRVRPLCISHGANSSRADRSKFRLEFDWTGTCNPSAMLCVPDAIATMSTLAGSFDMLIEKNHQLALAMRDRLCAAFSVRPSCPDEMTGAMATVAYRDSPPGQVGSVTGLSPLQLLLAEKFAIEVPVLSFPSPPVRWLRVSAQLYNSLDDIDALLAALAFPACAAL